MSLCCFTMDRPKTAPVRSDNFSFRINKQIDDDIKLEKKRHRNRTKMLLLGCGEAGKVVNGRGEGGDKNRMCNVSVHSDQTDEDHTFRRRGGRLVGRREDQIQVSVACEW